MITYTAENHGISYSQVSVDAHSHDSIYRSSNTYTCCKRK